MIRKTKLRFALALAATFLVTPSAWASLITNGDFEGGNLNGWTVFTTETGTTGITPEAASFDTTGNGASQAAHFRVGQSEPTFTEEGGGIFQTFTLLADGVIDISLDIASTLNRATSRNGAGGVFSLILDGVVLDSHDFGSIEAMDIERAMLSASIEATAGLHELRILMTRAFIQVDGANVTPEQYIDNVIVTAANQPEPPVVAVAEPGTLALMGLGLAGLGFARRRMKA